jgi:hypothetical protein
VGEKRGLSRVKKRLPCELEVDGVTHTGLVLDVSARGLFVQTAATPGPGTSLTVRLHPPGGRAIVVQGRVARRRMVPRRLASLASGGIGLRVESAPEEFFQLLAGARPAPAPAAAEPEPGRRFRVRVQQTSGPRSRTLVLAARDAADACARAVTEIGEGWSVLEVAPA